MKIALCDDNKKDLTMIEDKLKEHSRYPDMTLYLFESGTGLYEKRTILLIPFYQTHYILLLLCPCAIWLDATHGQHNVCMGITIAFIMQCPVGTHSGQHIPAEHVPEVQLL